MNIIDAIGKTLWVPIHREGWRFIAIGVLFSVVAGLFVKALFWIGMVLVVWMRYFFRDPERMTPIGKGLIISPADGKICAIESAVPPPELDLSEVPLLRVSVFMNAFNCHVNRMPISGTVKKMAYKPGKFFNAELDKSSEENERNGLIIEADGKHIGVVQIAGLMARRIFCSSKVDDVVHAGDRFGLIRFGSRVDIYLPPESSIGVAVGQTAVAGETVLAYSVPTDTPVTTYRPS